LCTTNTYKIGFRTYIEQKIGYSSFISRSFSSSQSLDNLSTPVTIKAFHDFNNNETVISYNKILRNKAGIYCFVNTVNNKRYIGSAKDLYLRLIEHLANKKSNIALQNAILK